MEETSANIKVWGYRNVWFRFEPFEATTIFPTSLQMMSTLDSMFMSGFESQKFAEFPAHELNGPFCDMARKVQVEQYLVIKTCLGRGWFQDHPSPLIRATRALAFIREMSDRAAGLQQGLALRHGKLLSLDRRSHSAHAYKLTVLAYRMIGVCTLFRIDEAYVVRVGVHRHPYWRGVKKSEMNDAFFCTDASSI